MVTLDGTGSTDANNDPITYKWSWGTKPTGSSTALSSATTAKPTFTVDIAGTYVITLIVSDGKQDSVIAATTITASAANAAPVANAGVNQNVTVAAVVTLDGTASSDANNDFITYKWTLVTRPTGSTAVLSLTYRWALAAKPVNSVAALTSATSAKPTFIADLAGVYVASLIVNDGVLDSVVSTTTITAAVANSAPVANAGPNQNVTTTSVVTLS